MPLPTDMKTILAELPNDHEQTVLEAVAATGGLMTPGDALALFRLGCCLPPMARILEIGSFRGASTTAFGHAIKDTSSEIYCLDCWHDYHGQGFFNGVLPEAQPTDHDILRAFLANTAFLGEQIRILKGASQQFRDLLPNRFFDLVFIDAAHDYKNVVNDIVIGLDALAPGGMLCGHDYHSDGQDVIRAVDDLITYNIGISVKGLIPGTSIWYAIPNS